MKKSILSLFLLFLIQGFAQTTNPAPYCVSQYSFNFNMWNYMKVGAVQHNFGPNGFLGQNSTYQFYNNVTFPTVNSGSTVTISLMPYAAQELEPIFFALFIDFNKNNVFEATENVMQNNNTINAALPTFAQVPTLITKTITIPATAVTGTYRMRLVREGDGTPYSSTYVVNPCITTATFKYGCTYDFNLSIVNALGTNEVEFDKYFSIYPIPAKNKLSIENNSKNRIANAQVIDMDGNIVYKNSSNESVDAIDVSEFEKGTYIITFELENSETYSTKFIKE